MDQAFAALITNLEDRGMLDSTLVFMSGEFGRTPKINRNGGRDHYAKVFSMAMAGGGLTRGNIYGQPGTPRQMRIAPTNTQVAS